MHELSLAKDLFREILSLAGEKRLSRIAAVRISVGEASGVDAEFLRHSLSDHIFPGTAADGARLDIRTARVEAACEGCGAAAGGAAVFSCPACGCREIEIKSGMDVKVEEVMGGGEG